jgi:DNA-binding transcriptional LysR family regulator
MMTMPTRPRPFDVDPRRLETFRVVAETGQVSAAARQLHLSQPAVSAQVRLLERELGQPLFARHATGMQLTNAGRLLLEYARRIRALLDDAGDKLLGERKTGTALRLAGSMTAAAHVLSPLVQRFLEDYRPRSLRLDVGNTDEVLAWVRAGRVQLGLIEGPAGAPGLSLQPYLSDELVPVRAVGGPRSLASVRTVADLENVPIIWREPGSGTRAVVERALRRARARAGPRESDLVIGDIESIKACVVLGLGIGFLSRLSIQREIAHGALQAIPLAGLSIPRVFSWVQPPAGATGPAAVFLRLALAHPPDADDGARR